MSHRLPDAEASKLHYSADVYVRFPVHLDSISCFIVSDSSKRFAAAVKSMVNKRPNKLANEYISWNRACGKLAKGNK